MKTYKRKLTDLSREHEILQGKFRDLITNFNQLLYQTRDEQSLELDEKLKNLQEKNTRNRIAMLMIREQVDFILNDGVENKK